MSFITANLLGAALDVVADVIDSSNKKEVELQKLNNEKTKIIAGAAVATAGIAAAAFVANKFIEKNDNIKVNTPNVSIEGSSNKKALSQAEDSNLVIDYDSIWIDRNKNRFGADLIDEQSGIINKIMYQIKGIGGKAYQIYESINKGKWQKCGIIDWSRMSIADLGKPENGGPIFAEIAKTALRLPQKQLR